MRVTPGELRHRVTLQQPAFSQVNGQPRANWTEVTASIPACVIAVAGGEIVRGKQIEAGIDTVVVMRHGLDKAASYKWSQHRLVHDSRYLNIVRAGDDEGTRQWLTCYCKEAA